MTYTVYDRSQELGAPIELYEFVYGPGAEEVYRYTNAETDQEGPGGTYTALPIKRATIKTNGKFEKTNLEIRLPINTRLSEMFLPYPPPQVVRCYVRGRHLNDPDDQAPLLWYGRIISSGRENHEAVLTCDNAILSWKRPGLRRNWQPGCPLLLYGPRCRADKTQFFVTFAVEGIGPDGELIFPAGWHGEWQPANFIRGTMNWQSQYGSESRTILRATETSITVTGFLRDVEAGTGLTLYLGCKHDLDDCRNVFDNVNNYGGQPWIPFKNPTKQHPFW